MDLKILRRLDKTTRIKEKINLTKLFIKRKKAEYEELQAELEKTYKYEQ
ncbi:hypothetical protein [Arcobacter vandammei]|nr:hypothetical protein [Arcobacter vandammei]